MLDPSSSRGRPLFAPPLLPTLTRWLLALALLLAANAVRLEWQAEVPGLGYPFATFLVAVAIGGLICGLVPSLALLLGGGLAGWWFALRPPGTWTLSAADTDKILLYVAAGGFLLLGTSLLRRRLPTGD